MNSRNLRTRVLTGALAGGIIVMGAAGDAASPHGRQAGQSAQAPAAQAAPQKPVATEQRPTFFTRIDMITTDVMVRDGRGQFIADLKKDDFEVYEDGVLQSLASMTLSHGGRVFNIQAPPPPPPQEGILLPPPRPTNDAAGRIFVVMIDDLHLDFRNTGRLRQLFKNISKTLIHEGDLFAVVSTGPSSIAQDLTYDRKRLDEIAKKISGNGLKPTDIINGPESQDGPSEVRYRAHVAFSTTNEFVKRMEEVRDRRKAVIYISEGYDFNPFEKARSGTGEGYFAKRDGVNTARQPSDTGDGTDTSNTSDEDPFLRQGQQFADADLARELAELTRSANRANASFYTIDPRGLVGMPDLDENIDPVEWQDYVMKSQDSLRVLAEQTGGIAVVNQNDFDKSLKRIDAETSDYYVLGYYSTNPDPTIRNRTIDVKVKRPDMTVWSRRNYTLKRQPVKAK